MSQQIFITSRERLNPRWQEAFGDAVYYSHTNFRAVDFLSPNAVFWLDVSQLEDDARLSLLQEVVGKVDKLMVMTDEQTDAEAMKVMQSGAVGYCHYLAAPEQLREIASVIIKGGLWIGAQLMQKLLSASVTTQIDTQADTQREKLDQIKAERADRLQQLTPREHMVALEVGKGATNKEIAEILDITERTVKAHISVVFSKLNIGDRVKLALFVNNI